MFSVTQRVKNVKQPWGGYIRPKTLNKKELPSQQSLFDIKEETIQPTTMGIVVDYLTRFEMGSTAMDAFNVSLQGARLISEGEEDKAYRLAKNIKGLDSESIVNACRLVNYDVARRAGVHHYNSEAFVAPDEQTLFNVREMVNRSKQFFADYGPVTWDGFTFAGGYTDIISSGDGDFLTASSLWDFKVSKNPPTKDHTLQLLVYYLMGLASENKTYFQELKHLSLFNPRLNTIRWVDVADIPGDVIHKVQTDVIGYNL